MINLNRCIFVLVQVLAMLGYSVSGFAQTDPYPARPVKIIVPFGPGGSADMLARVLGEGLSKEFGQSFQIENKAGATGWMVSSGLLKPKRTIAAS